MPAETFERALALLQSWKLEEATALLEGARAAGESDNRIHHDLSVLYAQQGLFAAALVEIEAALDRDPAHPALWHHFLALQKNNPVQPSPSEWKAMHLAYGDTLRERFDARYEAFARSRDPERKLRIGYLSPDTHNATERFVWPVLERFDRKAFEVVAYWSQPRLFATAAQRLPDVTHRSLAGVDHEALARAIVEDRIDILVDVAGHGAGNALGVLALKPAPIQMTWLDYLASTGLETVDYRITDEVADPAGAEASHVERLIRLPAPQWCYRPPADTPAPPPRTPGPPVFASVTVPLKLSDPLLDAWAELLKRMPDARLRFLGVPEGRARARIVDRMGAAGVGGGRIEFLGRLALADFFREVGNADVVLDSFPFSGATATLDALWMGTPVVTLRGPLSHGRSSASILTALGHPDWVAEDVEGYVAAAMRVATAAHDRAGLRAALETSVLCDGDRFARAMEQAFRKAWRIWSAKARPLAAFSTRELLATMPSHRATASAFWRDFRESPPDKRPTVRLDAIKDDWELIAHARFHCLETMSHTIPAALLESHDVLGSLGADALHRGDIFAAGRGHVAGVLAFAAAGADRIHCDLYRRDGFGSCVVLSGPVLLVRRKWLEGRDLTWRTAEREVDYRYGLQALSHELYCAGARLGLCTALATVETTTRIDLADERCAQLEWMRRLGGRRWTQEQRSASPVRALFSAAAWITVVPRFARFCEAL